MSVQTLQEVAGEWHRERFPEAQAEHVLLKAAEELGETASALNSFIGADLPRASSLEHLVDEAADVVVALLVLVDRWGGGLDLLQAVEAKLNVLNTPGAHRASRTAQCPAS